MDYMENVYKSQRTSTKREKLTGNENKENDQKCYKLPSYPPKKRVKIGINQSTTAKNLNRQPLVNICENKTATNNTLLVEKPKAVSVTRNERKTEPERTKTSKTSCSDLSTSDDLNKTFVVPSSSSQLIVVENFIKSKTSYFISPISPNSYTSSSVAVVNGIPTDVKHFLTKRSLARSAQIRPQRGSTVSFYPDIYNAEYLDDIIMIQLANDWKFVISKSQFENSGVLITTRTAVVNWLIQVQDYLQLSETILFSTIRLFDAVLNKITVPKNMYQLVGLTVLWIMYKYEESAAYLTPMKLLALCKNVYSTDQLLTMEKKMLTLLNFDLYLPDITIYIINYILKLLGNKDDLLLHCTLYVIECYLLNKNYSMTIPSLTAAAAVFITLHMHSVIDSWKKLKNVISYYNKEELENIIESMLNQIQKVQDPQYEYRYPYEKYTTKEKFQASIVFLHKLIYCNL